MQHSKMLRLQIRTHHNSQLSFKNDVSFGHDAATVKVNSDYEYDCSKYTNVNKDFKDR